MSRFACLIGLTAIIFLPTPSHAAVEQILTGLDMPVRLVAPAGDPRLFVVERTGYIRLFDRDGTDRGTFLDIHTKTSTFSERGLLGLAFPPDYQQTGRFYIHYTDLAGDSRIARYLVSQESADRADTNSGEIILTVDQPDPNHNGGHLEFGPDGMLYIGLGDGGGSNDTQNRAQNDQLLLGKMLRLDVSVPTGYAIPPGNPFVDLPPRDEIWAKGLRNPWCFAFDRTTGDLYIADVGQNDIEEVDVQPATSPGGENYGWRLMEGDECFNPPTGCNDGSLTLPVHTYLHGGNPFRCSISGGYVYRGGDLPSLAGEYFFADYCSNQIWSLTWSETGGTGPVVERTAEMTPPQGYWSVTSFGQDGFGELYVIDMDRGRIYRMVSVTSGTPEATRPPQLHQNVPNPFNPRTEIAFEVPHDGSFVSLKIYDPAGRLVRTLIDANLPATRHVAVWDGADQTGRRAAAGAYLYRLSVDGRTASRKMLLLE